MCGFQQECRPILGVRRCADGDIIFQNRLVSDYIPLKQHPGLTKLQNEVSVQHISSPADTVSTVGIV